MFNKTISIFNQTITIIYSVKFTTLFKARFIEPRFIRFITGEFLFLVGKTRLAVHLKRSQILSITSLIQVLVLSP
jgi:hypothetical protein